MASTSAWGSLDRLICTCLMPPEAMSLIAEFLAELQGGGEILLILVTATFDEAAHAWHLALDLQDGGRLRT